MRLPFVFLLFLGTAFSQDPGEAAPPPSSENLDTESMKTLNAYWADYKCFSRGDDNGPPLEQQCGNICKPNPNPQPGQIVTSSVSCIIDPTKMWDIRTGKPTDDEANALKIGYCKCNDLLIKVLGEFYVQSVKKTGELLHDVLCPLLKTLDIVIQIGLAAIPPPGKAVTGAMMTAIQTAKAYRYAYEGTQAAQEWADYMSLSMSTSEAAGCGHFPSIEELILGFDPLSKASDELIPGGLDYSSMPCPKGKCPPKKKDGDNNNGNNNNNDKKPSDNPKSDSGPSQTPKSDSQPSETPKSDSQSSATDDGSSRTPTPTATSDTPSGSSNAPESSSATSTSPDDSTSSETSTPSSAESSSANSTASSASSTSTSDEMPDSTSNPTETESETEVASFTSPAATSTPSIDCAAIGADDTEGLEVLRRDIRDTFQSRRFQKRWKFRKALACDDIPDTESTEMKSFNYPEADELKNGTAYGWKIPDSCNDYAFGKVHKGEFNTDQVLEWSVVTEFFTQMNNHSEFKGGFKDPRPDSKGEKEKVKFCTYWKASWDWPVDPKKGEDETYTDQSATEKRFQKLHNPDPDATDDKDIQLSPFGRIANAYPWKFDNEGKHLDESMLLQKKINSPVKSSMFDLKKEIYNDDDMKNLIAGKSEKDKPPKEPEKQVRLAIQRIRAVIGVFTYMQEKSIEEIFVREKDRIGKVIGHLDTALPKHPRKTKVDGEEKTYAPWNSLQLEEKWDKYMDNVFKHAKKKGTDFVEENRKRLNHEYNAIDETLKARKEDDTDQDNKKKAGAAEDAKRS